MAFVSVDYDLKKPRPPFVLPWPGMPNPVWAAKAKYLQGIIKEHGLKPAEFECKLGGLSVQFVPPWWKYGGMRDLHIHVGDQIYRLNAAQWKVVAEKLAADYRLDVQSAGTIPFMEMMDLASAAAVHKTSLDAIPKGNRAPAKPAMPKMAAAKPKAVVKPKAPAPAKAKAKPVKAKPKK